MATHSSTPSKKSTAVMLVFFLVSSLFFCGVLFSGLFWPTSVDLTGPTSPSLVYLKIDVVGAAPYWDPDSKQVSTAAYRSGGACSGAFINESGAIATAGHCTNADSFKQDIVSQATNAMSRQFMDCDPKGTCTRRPDAPDTRVSINDVTDFSIKVTVSQTALVDDSPLAGETEATILNGGSYEHNDVSILRVYQLKHRTTPLPIADREPAIGETLRQIGFPGQATQSNMSGTTAGAPVNSVLMTPKITPAPVTDRRPVNGVLTWMTDGQAEPGMSGGPAVNANGEIVGVNSGGSMSFSTITSLDDLRTKVWQSGVMQAPTDPSIPRAKADIVYWAMLVINVLLGIGAVVSIATLVRTVIALYRRSDTVSAALVPYGANNNLRIVRLGRFAFVMNRTNNN